MYSQQVWDDLAKSFIKAHHELFSLPARPLLETALSAGMSALKTPACHSIVKSSSANASSTTTSVCPICSKELHELARDLPYAQHSKSWVEDDPVVLPNGRMYGRSRLLVTSDKANLETGKIKDPTTGQIFEESEMRKVFIS
jgi:macrophage erythroblast attacher